MTILKNLVFVLINSLMQDQDSAFEYFTYLLISVIFYSLQVIKFSWKIV